jgi:hypothetical protein
VTTSQLSLLQGDPLAQYRFTVCALLEDALRVCRTALIDDAPASRHDVDRAIVLIGRLAVELRSLPGEAPLPF